jgi:hypothetical protein
MGGHKMPLFDLKDKEQPRTGRQEHWALFEPFQSRPLHDAIVDEIESHIDALEETQSAIDSSWLGSEILGRLEAESVELFDEEVPDQVGGLFGMTLWNHLAQHSDDWWFVPKEGTVDRPEGTKYFRRPRI